MIIPTRERPQALCNAIDSVYSLAAAKDQLQFLLKIDDDDHKTIELYERFKKVININAIISPRGNGYLDMHHWVNDLALNYAKGDWIYLFSDDAVLGGNEQVGPLSGQNWDERLYAMFFESGATWHSCPDICSLLTTTSDRPMAEFFFLRRKVVEVLGHYALNPHTNLYLQSVLCFISSSFRFPMIALHKKDGVRTEEELSKRKLAWESINTFDALEARNKDVKKLIAYIESWRRERCTECKKHLTTTPSVPCTDGSYVSVPSDCSHGNYLLCKECSNDGRVGNCPVCGTNYIISTPPKNSPVSQPSKSKKDVLTLSF